MLALVTLNNF